MSSKQNAIMKNDNNNDDNNNNNNKTITGISKLYSAVLIFRFTSGI